jgi:hypothetical protein
VRGKVNSTAALKTTAFRSPASKIHCALDVAASATIGFDACRKPHPRCRRLAEEQAERRGNDGGQAEFANGDPLPWPGGQTKAW